MPFPHPFKKHYVHQNGFESSPNQKSLKFHQVIFGIFSKIAELLPLPLLLHSAQRPWRQGRSWPGEHKEEASKHIIALMSIVIAIIRVALVSCRFRLIGYLHSRIVRQTLQICS